MKWKAWTDKIGSDSPDSELDDFVGERRRITRKEMKPAREILRMKFGTRVHGRDNRSNKINEIQGQVE